MGHPDDRFGMLRLTPKTALPCIGRVCALQGIRLKNGPPQLDEASQEERLPIEQLVVIAHKSRLRLQPIHVDWVRLSADLSNRPILLVLNNGNVIVAEELSTSEDIVVFDPIAGADERFLVARSELEPVWDGDAITVEPELGSGWRPRTKAIALTAILGILTAALLVVFVPRYDTIPNRPNASLLGVSEQHTPPSSASNPGQHHSGDAVRDNHSQSDISQLHGSTARKETSHESPPGAEGGSEFGNFAATSAGTQQQELTSQNGSPRWDTDQLSLKQPVIADAERSHEQEPVVANGAPELPQGQPASSESDESIPIPGQEALTSSGPQATFDSNEAKPKDGMPGPPIVSATTSADKPAGLEATNRADTSDGGLGRSARLTGEEVKALITRGDEMLGSDDVTSARLFYERAADAADARAALRLGESYDPAFLAGARLSPTMANIPLAAQWYRRAGELGAPEADTMLRALAITTGISR
jgi:hypothetical protein